MSKKGISRFTLRLSLIAAVLVCAIFACAGAAYASAESVAPEKNADGVYEIYTADQLEIYLTIASGQPYEVENQETGLYETIADADKNASCKLMNDIDYTGSTIRTNSTRFYSESDPFTGTFDGNGKTIENIPNYFASSQWDLGSVIGYNNGTIKNVTLNFGDIEVQAKNGTRGLLCGKNMSNGILTGVTIEANITSGLSDQYILCALNQGTILNCSTHGSMTCSGSGGNAMVQHGGYVGEGIMINCYNTADITNTGSGQPYGISFYANERIKNCYNIGRLFRGTTERFDLTNNDNALVKCYKSTDEFTAADLGDAYMDDLEGEDALNNGYPVLKYQITGEYPRVESIEDLTISAVKAVSETSVTFTTDTVYTYYAPKQADFSITAVNQGGVQISLPAESLSWGAKTKTIGFSSILNAQTDEGKAFVTTGPQPQNVTIKIVAGGRVLAETTLEIPASDDWRDYEEKPEILSMSDDRYDGKFGGYYMIKTPEELAWFADNYPTDASAFLASDIDLGEHKWYGIGRTKGTSNITKFTGTFDGNGYKITNVYSTSGTGLVCELGDRASGTDGLIKNVCIENGYVTHNRSAGGIVGFIHRGSVVNCSFSGEVKTEGAVSYINEKDGTAGIAAASYNNDICSITGCVNYAKITGNQTARTGGIAGHSGGLTITDCYNMGDTNGSGITGTQNGYHTTVKNSYSAGKVSNSIAGGNSYTLVNCYILAGTGSITGSVELFTEEDAKDGTLLSYLDSDEFVSDDEDINNGYPILKWQSPLAVAIEKYPNEISNYVDLDDYRMNKAKIQAIIDDAIAKINAAATSAEAKAALDEAKAAIDAIPSDAQAAQQMADELARLQEQIKNANKTLAFDMCLISLDKTSFTYTGKAFEPAVKATNKDGTALVKDTDFEVVYEANTEPGVGKVKVTGKGEKYAGTRELTFKILPKKNKITSLKKAKKAFTVKWTKDDKATGYQVSYGLKKNFKGAKTVKITKNTTVSKKVSKLKAKKKYFVRVRAYVTSGGQTIYGAWSPVKSVKTK